MTTIYVKEQGAKIGRKGERLVISKDQEVIKEYPLVNVQQLNLFGNVQLTTQAVATLLERDIDVTFLSIHGKFRGRLTGNGSPHVRLRQQQYQRLRDPKLTLGLAKAFVDGKIHNQRVVLQRQTRRLASPPQAERGRAVVPADPALFKRSLNGMMKMQRAAQKARDVDALRGYEGQAAANYFQAVRTLLEDEWRFQKRDYYPPPDPFNALLSFAYSLLLKDVNGAVNSVGLDPYLGSFHEVAYGRPSLALDLMEEWRPYVADALVLELINRGSLQPRDFHWTGRPKRPVELGEEGVAVVLNAYGRRLETLIFHPGAGPAGGQTTLRQAIELQARQFAQVILGRRESYDPVKAK